MPSITTHHYFAIDVYNKLDKKTKKILDKEITIYHTFAQSHDYLFYYTFNIFNFKRIKSFGHYAHRNNTQKYLYNIIKEIKKNNLENNSQAIAYLYGSITHYCLDTTCHPYIFYKTGVYNHKNPLTKKYHGEHNHIEKDLDAIYYKKNTNKEYNNCNITKDIIKKPKFSKELNELIDNSYQKTYNVKNISKYYKKGIKDARIISSLFVNDKTGLKRKIYKTIDQLSKNKFGHLEYYSTYNINPNTDYLNENHNTWNHPSIPHKKYSYSFEELYNISLNKSLKIIKQINKILYENQEIDSIIKYIPDLDYSTGLLIKNNKKMKYFEN